MTALHSHLLLSSSLLLLISCTTAAPSNCKPGTFSSASSCKPCPAGTFSTLLGAQGIDICTPCPSGTFSKSTGSTSPKACMPCPRGTSSAPGTTVCVSCKPRQFITADKGNRFERKSICKRCFFSFSDKPNAFECKPCPLPLVANSEGSACKRCARGQGFDGRRCLNCLYGTMGDGTAPCKECPSGSQPNRQMNADRCLPCPAGTARFTGSAFLFMQFCEPCKNGENKGATGSSFCLPPNTPCPSGWFMSKQRSCQTCRKGERFDAAKKSCVVCGRNQQSEGGVSTRCTRCPKGKVSGPDGCVCGAGHETLPDGSCSPCAPGTFAGRVLGQTFNECHECGPNEFSSKGASQCIKCPDSMIVKKDRTGCQICPKGTQLVLNFGAIDGPRCIDPRTNCEKGDERVVSEDGTLLRCQPNACPAGTVEIFKNLKIAKTTIRYRECLDCLPGSVADLKKGYCIGCGHLATSEGGGATKCKQCPAGLFRTESGSKCGCVFDIDNFEVFEGFARGIVNGRCRVCSPGTFAKIDPLGKLRPSSCLPCPRGSFQDTRGRDRCKLCEPGRFSNRDGATKCQKCLKGTTSFGVGDTGCVKVGSLKKGGKSF